MKKSILLAALSSLILPATLLAAPADLTCSAVFFEFSAKFEAPDLLRDADFTICAPDFCQGPEEEYGGVQRGVPEVLGDVPGYRFSFDGVMLGAIFIPEDFQAHPVWVTVRGRDYKSNCKLKSPG